jgi:hypothetical protein
MNISTNPNPVYGHIITWQYEVWQECGRKQSYQPHKTESQPELWIYSGNTTAALSSWDRRDIESGSRKQACGLDIESVEWHYERHKNLLSEGGRLRTPPRVTLSLLWDRFPPLGHWQASGRRLLLRVHVSAFSSPFRSSHFYNIVIALHYFIFIYYFYIILFTPFTSFMGHAVE